MPTGKGGEDKLITAIGGARLVKGCAHCFFHGVKMSDLHRVITEHDPEADAGHVTWADIAIIRALLQLSRRIDLLEQQPPEPHTAGLVAALRQWVNAEEEDIHQEYKRAMAHQSNSSEWNARKARVDGRAAQLAALVAFLDGYLSE